MAPRTEGSSTEYLLIGPSFINLDTHILQTQDEEHSIPRRGPDGRFKPVEQVYPLQESFIGGFRPPPSPVPSHRAEPPPLPPKDDAWPQSDTAVSNGHPVDSVASTSTQTASFQTVGTNSYYLTSQHLVHMSAVERSEALRVARMQPYLQFMAGPMLRYDTIDEQGVWRGAAMIVSTCCNLIRCGHVSQSQAQLPMRVLYTILLQY